MPELIEAAESGKRDARVDLLATITSQREWGDFGLTEEQLLERFARDRAAQRRRRAARLLRGLRRAGRQAALGREDADLRARAMRKIERALPEARFVHVIRDGRDVALSIRDRAIKEHPIDR